MDRKVMIKISSNLSEPVGRPRMQIRLKSSVQDLMYDAEVPLNKMDLVDAIREGFQMLLDAEDVAPVVHSEWKEQVYSQGCAGNTSKYICERCGRVERIKYPYCHCGAKMDGGTKP